MKLLLFFIMFNTAYATTCTNEKCLYYYLNGSFVDLLPYYRAMARAESACGIYKDGAGGEIGLFQLKLTTVRKYDKTLTRKKLYDNSTNYKLSRLYFESLLRKYNSVPKALAAYNSGIDINHPFHCRIWTDSDNITHRSAGCYVKKIYAFIKEGKLCSLELLK
jgi:hypothetical protein